MCIVNTQHIIRIHHDLHIYAYHYSCVRFYIIRYLSLSLSLSLYIYIYICTHAHTHTHCMLCYHQGAGAAASPTGRHVDAQHRRRGPGVHPGLPGHLDTLILYILYHLYTLTFIYFIYIYIYIYLRPVV